MDTRDKARREFSGLYVALSNDDTHVWAFSHGSRVIECGLDYLEAMRARGRAVRLRMAEVRADAKGGGYAERG